MTLRDWGWLLVVNGVGEGLSVPLVRGPKGGILSGARIKRTLASQPPLIPKPLAHCKESSGSG